MTEEEMALKIVAIEHEVGSLKHRMDKQEEQSATIQDLVLSVQKLAMNMESMLKEQGVQGKKIDAQGERLDSLEQRPAETWDNMKRTILQTCVSVISGGFITGVILMIAQNIH